MGTRLANENKLVNSALYGIFNFHAFVFFDGKLKASKTVNITKI